jgi:hypothetical protein
VEVAGATGVEPNSDVTAFGGKEDDFAEPARLSNTA